jgi:hypothetical protein
MAQELARAATPEIEDTLLAKAGPSTVRAMRHRLRPDAGEDDAAPARRTVTASVPVEDAWLWEMTIRLVEHVAGRSMSLDEKVEALLAEGWTRLMDARGADEVLEHQEHLLALREAWLRQLEAWRAQAEAGCEARGWDVEPVPAAAQAQPGEPPDPSEELDQAIRGLAREIQARDGVLGDLVSCLRNPLHNSGALAAPGCVAPPLNTLNIRGRRALPGTAIFARLSTALRKYGGVVRR